MKLYGHSVSPYFERIMMVLEAKGQLSALERADIPGGFKSEQHLALHPLGKIPFLALDDGTSITEGQCVLEYLDATLEGPKILPESALDIARVNQIIRAMDIYYVTSITAIGRAAFGGSSTDEELKDARDRAVPEAFRYLEYLLSDREFSIGDTWTSADATVWSHLYWYERLAKQFDMPSFDPYPKISAYWARAATNEIYLNSKARADASVAKFFAGSS